MICAQQGGASLSAHEAEAIWRAAYKQVIVKVIPDNRSLMYPVGILIALPSKDVSQILVCERPNLLAWTGKPNLGGLPVKLGNRAEGIDAGR